MIKRFIDILIGLFGMILSSPLILFSAFIIKLDGGPIFYYQNRVGLKGNVFRIYKLRTMVVDADQYLDTAGVPTRNRITRFGRIMRVFSIDEIPQFLNILRGEMTLVGPRPILPTMLPFLTKVELKRFDVKPGVTGLAQVKGRNTLKWSHRFRYDVFYVRRQSFVLELWILCRTLRLIILGSGVVHDRNIRSVDDITIRALSRSGKDL